MSIPRAGDEVWRQQIDRRVLLVALTRRRRSAGLAARAVGMQDKVLAYLVDFDDQVPSLTTLRNVAEHFDNYTTGKGRDTQIKRHQLQVWSPRRGSRPRTLWRWLGTEFSVKVAHVAATGLYRNFLADANDYLAGVHE